MKSKLAKHIASAAVVIACAVSAPVAPAIAANVSPIPAATLAASAKAPAQVGELWRRTELFFGTSKPDGSAVTEEALNQFVDAEITPRFPDGLTALTGYGQFKNSAGVIIQEQSVMLILLYPPNMREANSRIEEIRSAYKEAFQQESVLRVDSFARVSF
jgi:hypothetical protein